MRTDTFSIDCDDSCVDVYGFTRGADEWSYGKLKGETRLVNISVTDDWCGDTETGFGATVSTNISLADAKRLFLKLAEIISDLEAA